MTLIGGPNPYAAGGLFDQHKMVQKALKNDWNPGTWVLIWESSGKTTEWISTWQGLLVSKIFANSLFFERK